MTNKHHLLGEGREGKVYLINDEAIKIYNYTCDKRRLNKEDATKLSKIKTKRILTPTRIFLDKEKEIKGYSTKYIENLNINNLLILKRELLLEELSILKEDLLLLSDNNILVEDFNKDNTCFNNGIYLIDPGSYECDYDLDKNQILGKNIEIMNEFLLDIMAWCSHELTKNTFTDRKLTQKIFHDYIEKKYPDLIEYLKENVKENNNISEFIHKKTK